MLVAIKKSRYSGLHQWFRNVVRDPNVYCFLIALSILLAIELMLFRV